MFFIIHILCYAPVTVLLLSCAIIHGGVTLFLLSLLSQDFRDLLIAIYLPPTTMRQRGSCLSQVYWSAALTALLLFVVISLSSLYTSSSEQVRSIIPHPFRAAHDAAQPTLQPPTNVTVVVASISSSNTSWLQTSLPSHWTKTRYITDSPSTSPSVPINKGREAMVYLSFLIDNYASLPPITIFSHADRYQWHNDDPLYDGARMLSHLQLPYVLEKGYVSLRCSWHYGCPSEIRPYEHGDEPAPGPEKYFTEDVKPWFYKPAFETMFPGTPVPEVIGAGCCSQFAVSASKILERPLADYERVRRWLIETDLPDNVSGRLMEYIWHVLFGMESVLCPSAEECYCRVFGKCEVQCESEGGCEGQWVYPVGEKLPEGWPEWGFEGEWRDVEALREKQEEDYTLR
jgi:hypothetical protein